MRLVINPKLDFGSTQFILSEDELFITLTFDFFFTVSTIQTVSLPVRTCISQLCGNKRQNQNMQRFRYNP